MERHLARCPACRLEIEGIRSLVGDFETVGLPDPPDGLVASTKDVLRQSVRTDLNEQGRAIPSPELKVGRRPRLRSVLAFSAGFVGFAILLIVLLPVDVTPSFLGGLFKTPSSPRLSQASAEFLTNVLGFLPLLLVPSIVVNAGLLLRRKRHGHDQTIRPLKV